MARIYIPKETSLARSLRGFGAPGEKPLGPIRIDWSNSLAHGLKAYYPQTMGFGSRDLIHAADIPTYSGSAENRPAGLYIPNEADYVRIPRSWNFHNKSKITIAFTYVLPGTLPNDISANIIGSAGSFARINIRNYSGNLYMNSYLFIAGSYRNSNSAIVTGAANAGDRVTGFITFDNPLLNTHGVFNGVLYSDAAKAYGAPIDDDAGADLVFGADGSSPTNGTTGTIECVAFYDRVLSDEEKFRFDENPYQFLDSANQSPFFIGTAAASGHALTADDIDSDSQISAPTVAQVHALTAADIDSDSQVSAPTVAQVHALTAADIDSDSQISSPALTAEGEDALTAADIDSDSQVSAPAITQVHALTAADIDSDSQVSAPTLTGPGVNPLTANDIDSDSQISAPTFAQVHVLTAASIDSDSAVSVPSLLGDIDIAAVYAKVCEIWAILGLDTDNPMTVTPTSRVSGDISQTISGDGVSSTTVTRD